MTTARISRRTAVSASLAGLLLLPHAVATAQTADPWAPIRFMQGDWRGVAEGEPGKGTVERSYGFVLENRFIQERNVSTYEPKPGKTSGEVHEHWSFFSHDRKRAVLVLRQFYSKTHFKRVSR